MFIRAPAILQTGSSVKVLSTVVAPACANAHEEVEKFMSSCSSQTNNNSTNNTDTATAANGNGNIARKIDHSNPSSPDYEVVIAVQKENILATAFHPELTIPPDLRWHKYFLNIVKNSKINK